MINPETQVIINDNIKSNNNEEISKKGFNNDIFVQKNLLYLKDTQMKKKELKNK